MQTKKRKKGQRSGTGEVKREIIKYALEHGGMFEEPTLKDFLEEKVNVRRDTVKKHLSDLEKKGIFKKTGEKGYANIWQIIEDVKAIEIIYKEFHLLQHLQQSDFILDCIVEKHSLLFPDHNELKEMLRSSAEFFEVCLIDDEKDFKERIHNALKLSTCEEIRAGNEKDTNALYNLQWELFLWCTRIDIMKGVFTEEALEIVKKKLSTLSSVSELIASSEEVVHVLEWVNMVIEDKGPEAAKKILQQRKGREKNELKKLRQTVNDPNFSSLWMLK